MAIPDVTQPETENLGKTSLKSDQIAGRRIKRMLYLWLENIILSIEQALY